MHVERCSPQLNQTRVPSDDYHNIMAYRIFPRFMEQREQKDKPTEVQRQPMWGLHLVLMGILNKIIHVQLNNADTLNANSYYNIIIML